MDKKATVSEINAYIKTLMDYDMVLNDIWVLGEISNFKHHWSGHMYMSLKDEHSNIKAVMFKGANSVLSFVPENGMSVMARGKISVFPRDGQYQLYIEEMLVNGTGDLHLAFEKLKEKLKNEGLFDESRKKQIPACPKTVGIVTSSTGAAVRDIINVISRRFKFADILLYPASVQGEGAAKEIADGVRYFNQNNSVDVLIVGRGGGSLEDLWAFNEEILARAIAESNIPVISAVGHETDFTICDFVSDLRAPTPSAAAELAVPDTTELLNTIKKIESQLTQLTISKLHFFDKTLKLLKKHFSPEFLSAQIDGCHLQLDSVFNILYKNIMLNTEVCEKKLGISAAKIDAFSPLKTLSRGYSVAYDRENRILFSSENLKSGDYLSIKFNKGSVECEIKKVING